ncbi:MAG: metal ABC transporter solute-binding protein, Zn/Mn family [Methermicoccaceae archaeon]
MRKVMLVGVFLIAILLSVASGCVGTNSQSQEKIDDNRIGVVVTILPQAEFVEKIGGDKVKVMVMVPPGASPHTYEPTPSQLREVSEARMYAKVGSGIEFELSWMDKIINMNQQMLVVNCSKGVELINNDPHIWLSVKNAEIMVDNIYQGLIQIDPSNQEYYLENKEKYLEQLDELDENITQELSNKKNKKIMVYHPAWTYFCKDYGLEQIPIEEGGKEPTPKEITELIKEARENNVSVIFASPEFNTESAEVIATEINGEVVLISTLPENYLESMGKVAEAFAKD